MTFNSVHCGGSGSRVMLSGTMRSPERRHPALHGALGGSVHVADLGQVQVHRRGVAEGQRQCRCLAVPRADGAVDGDRSAGPAAPRGGCPFVPIARSPRLSVWGETVTRNASHSDWPRSHSRQRTTPCTAGIGPRSICAASAWRCIAVSRGIGPDALRSSSPAGPSALNRIPQSGTICSVTLPSRAGRVPPGGVGAVGKWPAGATAESLAQAGHLPTAAATEAVTVAAPGRVGLHTQL